MSVETGGPIRGLIGRWLMRIQAVQGILQLVGIAVTAASTLTSALVAIGRPELAPYVMALGCVGAPLFAFVYVEYGLFNRKNRENVERGNNFATPRDQIDNSIMGAANFAVLHGRPPTQEEREAIREATQQQWAELRDGVNVE